MFDITNGNCKAISRNMSAIFQAISHEISAAEIDFFR